MDTMTPDDSVDPVALLARAGVLAEAASEWMAAEPTRTADLATDRARYAAFWERSAALLAELPTKRRRSDAEAAAAALVLGRAREARDRFLAVHAEAVYDEVTARGMLRVEELVFAFAAAVPGLAPSPEAVAAEMASDQGDKDGIEIDQGLLLAHVLASPRTGTSLCHAMLLPRPESADLAARFAADGRLDLGTVRIERRGRAVQLTAGSPRFLNAEDDTTLDRMEAAVDVAILDPASEIIVVRGGPIAHPKYEGRRVFGAGINLTHLYRGNIPFVWFMRRDLGYVHKLFRGVARPDVVPDDLSGRSTEKPWIAAVDGFAIGGHCQLLLVADYVLAADDAFMTLPARKEGIIPGFANLRLSRLAGERLARQAILYERKLACDSPEGRLICDEIVASEAMDDAIERVVTGLTDAGPVSAIGNRRAFRIAQEPLEAFRRYASVYAREQAYCHFSPALIANLERNWDARNRRA
ncbi:MAG: enoyl-CoA hydratase/isomerase family protein [Bauldia sp.]|nr:enoyl-CoA hydratase/isomerase family protein [Bauldia sp.]